MVTAAPSAVDLFAGLTRSVRAVAQAGAAELESFGLTPAQLQLLVRIRSHPAIAQRDVADAFGVTRGNISQLVKKVEGAGLVARERTGETEELRLTAAGEQLLDRVLPAHRAFMERTFSVLSAEERGLLHDLIQRLAGS